MIFFVLLLFSFVFFDVPCENSHPTKKKKTSLVSFLVFCLCCCCCCFCCFPLSPLVLSLFAPHHKLLDSCRAPLSHQSELPSRQGGEVFLALLLQNLSEIPQLEQIRNGHDPVEQRGTGHVRCPEGVQLPQRLGVVGEAPGGWNPPDEPGGNDGPDASGRNDSGRPAVRWGPVCGAGRGGTRRTRPLETARGARGHDSPRCRGGGRRKEEEEVKGEVEAAASTPWPTPTPSSSSLPGPASTPLPRPPSARGFERCYAHARARRR